ncbi:EamA family transporter [Jatrophihabitans sp. YIM 134969]
MTTTTDAPTVAPAAGHRDRAEGPVDRVGFALMLGSGASNQTGAAVAALGFPALGPVGVVAIRQWVAAVAMLAVARPRVRAWTAHEWRPVLALALVFAGINVSLYTAVDRIGLGLAVTLEFLGPLTVGLLGSRRRLDVLCALAAAAGVVVLTRPQPSTDYVGIGLAFLAGACWAVYILVNRTLGARVPGPSGPAVAQGVSALVYVPLGVLALVHGHPTWGAVGAAAIAGVLCSALPFLADLAALRRVPARFFGVFMSVNPVFAAAAGWVVLGQGLAWSSWLAIGLIVAANVVNAVASARAGRA